MSDNTRTLALRVTGRVQGVNFRNFACAEARRLGLRGWVTNRPDGSVEGVAFGAGTALAEFVAACRQGPPAAKVDGIDVRSADAALAHAPPPEAYRF